MRTMQVAAMAFCLSIPAMAQQVVTQFDRSVNFTNYKTYKWITITGAEQTNQITSQNITNIINAQLATKGLTQVETNPDLLVGFQTAQSQQQQLNYFGTGGGWRFGGGMGQVTSSTIHTGQLVVDMYAPGPKTLVWRGSVADTLNPSSNPDKNYQKLEKAVKKLLNKYPPTP